MLDDISDLFARTRISLLIVLFAVNPDFKTILILIIFHPTFVQSIRSIHLDPKLPSLHAHPVPASCRAVFPEL